MADVGLLGFDPAALQAIVAQFAPSEDEKKRAFYQSLFTMGAGLIGTRKGMEMPALGQAGLLGMGQYNDAIKQMSQQKRDAMTNATSAMGLQEMMRKYTDENAAREVIRARYAQAGQPGMPSSDISGSMPSSAGMPSLNMGPPSPIDGTQQQLPQTSSASIIQSGTKQSKYDQFSAIADDLSRRGLVDQAQKYQDYAEKFRPKLKDTKTLTQNGQRVTVNIYDDGTTSIVPFGPDQEKAHFLDTGQQIGAVDPFTGQRVPGGGLFAKQVTPDEQMKSATSLQTAAASNALGYAHLTETQRHNQMVEGDPAVIEQTAQGIASGNLAPLSGFALGRPMGQAVMARVMQINPEFSGKDFGTGQKAEKDFATGKPGQQVRSFNVAISHLDSLGTLATALQNGDMVLINKAGNFIQQQTGNPAPTNFNAAKKIVGDEIVKAIVGSGGGVEDRAQAAKALDAANSPAQLKGVIDTHKNLMAGQLNGLRQQYETSTKRKDFDRMLSPQSLSALSAGSGLSVRSQADAILQGR